MNPSNACGPHPRPAQGRWLSPDPSGLAAVNPANPQTWNEYAYVASQPLTATDPLGLMTISIGIGGVPCDMFAGPRGGGFGGPGPCDVTGWNPWPAAGRSGGGLGGGIGISIIGFGGGGGGGGTVVGTPSGPASGAPPPYTAGICSPANPVSTQGASPGTAAGALLNALINACAGNGLCVAGAGAPGGSESHLLSNLTQKPPAKSGGPFWKRPGCGKAIGETAAGALIMAGTVAAAWFLGPEILATAGGAVVEDGGIGVLDATHLGAGSLQVFVPGLTLTTYGIKAIGTNCG